MVNLSWTKPRPYIGGLGTLKRQFDSLVRLFPRVHPRVPREISREPELFVAVLARQRLLRRVYLLVLVQVLGVGECLSAMAALLRGLKRE